MKLNMDKNSFTVPEQTKNTDGHLGPICSYCGGYGFTNVVGGKSLGCTRCQQTGIEPPDLREMHEQLKKLTSLVGDIITSLQENDITITHKKGGKN